MINAILDAHIDEFAPFTVDDLLAVLPSDEEEEIVFTDLPIPSDLED